MPTDTSTDLVSEFYPLTRQQLDVPAIPLLRLEPLVEDVASATNGTPEPHFKPRQAGENPFTVAVRTSASLPLASPPEKPSPRLPEVRFAVSNGSDVPSTHYASTAAVVKQMAASTASERVSVAETSQIDDGQVGAERDSSVIGASYPFWLTALAQIVIGTLIVILLVKFANLVRDSFNARLPMSAATAMGWQEDRESPQLLVQPAEFAVRETEHWL